MNKATPIIVPTVTAYDLHEYRRQLESITPFAKRIHIDLMDGIFAPTKSPDIEALWLPHGVQCDIHVMFQHPYHQIKKLLKLNPHLIIFQAEADSNSVEQSIRALKQTRVQVGISLLPETKLTDKGVAKLVAGADYVLIFSGHLGFHGGVADLSLLEKVDQIKALNSKAEIAWDGGISLDNVQALSKGGVTVLNVGGAIQKSIDPVEAFNELSQKIAVN